MCLWLLTACLGMLPANPSPRIVLVGVPPPILLPTAAPTTTTTATTTARPTGPPTGAPSTMAPMVTLIRTAAPTVAPTIAPTVAPTVAPTMPTAPSTMATTMGPPTMASSTMGPPTMAPTMAPTMGPPTMAPTMAPMTMAPTMAPTMGPPPTGGVLLSVLLCTDPDVICVINPDNETTAGPAIDPRLGTTPSANAAYQVLPINAYNGQSPYDSAVRFPREKRSTTDNMQKVKEGFYSVLNSTSNATREFFNRSKHIISKRQTACSCVPAGTCGTLTNNGAGLLDVRIVTPGGSQCPLGQVYCCGATTSTIACGTLQAVPGNAITPAAGQASYGEFPWQGLILSKQNDYLAGGVLIDQMNVLTVTHRLVNYVVSGTAPNVKVRLGDWNAGVTTEPVPFQEYNVARVFTHPSYNPTTLQFDLTVLRLAAPVPLTPAAGAAVTINRACLPPSSTTTYTGQRCWVSGWGKNMFGVTGQYQDILKKVDVPIVPPAACQTQLQIARLGANYLLDTTSFVCAGGEANKDSCTGDGGSGLVCNVAGQWVLVGLVSWGLGCANANVPGVYVNVAGLLPWIQQQVATP